MELEPQLIIYFREQLLGQPTTTYKYICLFSFVRKSIINAGAAYSADSCQHQRESNIGFLGLFIVCMNSISDPGGPMVYW